MAQNPKATRQARKVQQHQDRIGLRIIREVKSEDPGSRNRPTRKMKGWRKALARANKWFRFNPPLRV